MADFEASGAAATEVGLPMNMILSQLPSGKVEMPLSDLVPHFPAGYLQPTESIASYLPTLINLPLMDVVMRIPPDLLALRPDQKDVDAAVINMADPFTEEILREQAEAARRAAAAAQPQTNIIDESQVPQAEEFVPQAQQPPAPPKTIAPPPRPSSTPLPTSRPPSVTVPPAPQTSRLPAPPMPGGLPSVAPSAPTASARTISPSGPSGRLPMPTRSTAAIPARTQASVPSPSDAPSAPLPRQTSSVQAPPIPPVPRQTGALPVAAMPRQTSALPMPPRPPVPQPPSAMRPSSVPTPPAVSKPAPVEAKAPAPIAATPVPPVAPVAASPVPPAAPDQGADELQRLAALAMAAMGEESTEPEPAESESFEQTIPTAKLPDPEPEPEPVAATPPPAPTPAPIPEFKPEPVAVAPPVAAPIAAPRLPAPEPVAPPAPPTPAPAAPTAAPTATQSVAAAKPVEEPKPEAQQAAGNVAFNLNTCTADELVQNIPGCFPDLAESIIEHRTKIGSFKRIEDLLDVPGITKAAYTNLTGEAPPENRIPLSLNELLGFPPELHISLKDVTERIACWPDVTGCMLSQSTGLSLVGTAPEGLDKEAIVAFAPRMFDALNKSFTEITGLETDAIILPTPGNSFHIFRNKELYLIILCRLPQMPERHMKVARFVLSALSIRRD